MNEQEWETSTDPIAMLDCLRSSGWASERKLRLFTCACCRLVWHLLIDERSRLAVEVAEHYAEGLLGEEEREAAFRKACYAFGDVRRSPAAWPETTLRFRRPRDPDSLVRVAFLAAFACGSSAGDIQTHLQGEDVGVPDGPARCQLLRCIFDPPSSGPGLNSSWLTTNVVALARFISDERDFACLPVLADALEDAGCTRRELLNHLRKREHHALGCWGVDAILGRE
jgi:hypothetical protein